jgi:poly-gamma-glutamate synthase PgsB/CapB
LARAIFPDGTEYPVFRPFRANVIEQRRIVHLAAQQSAEALVIECMAVQPSLQSLCELKLVRSTHGVITNARADHLDVMGPTAVDVAKALAATVPINGRLYTAEQTNLPVFNAAALDRSSVLTTVDDDAVANIGWDELERFSYVEHPDNVALALKVCTDLGIDRQTALEGMWAANPDPGVMKLFPASQGRKRLVFVNGFAANDPESTGKIWDMMVTRHANCQRRIAVFNCRADRVDRSVQLAKAAATWQPADRYILTGTARDIFSRVAADSGLPESKITEVDGSASNAIQEIWRWAGRSTMVMGMGNIAGPGMDLVEHFERSCGVGTARIIPMDRKRFFKEAA